MPVIRCPALLGRASCEVAMKKFLCCFLIFALLIPCVFVFASASSWFDDGEITDGAITDGKEDPLNGGVQIEPFPDDMVEVYSYTDDFGSSFTEITVGPEQRYYFQLWDAGPDGTWNDYIGAYWNESPKLQVPSISGRVRPFGNTDLNIGGVTNETDQIRTGNYLSFKTVGGKSGIINFHFGFSIKDCDQMGGMLPPYYGDLEGYFYIFLVRPDGTLLRVGYPVKYDWEYAQKSYSSIYTCTVTIDFYKLNPGSAVGFIPMFTFRNLPTNSNVNQIFFPHFTMDYSLTYQQNLMHQLDGFLNSTFDPENFDPDNIVGDTGDVISGITKTINQFSKSMSTVYADSADSITDNAGGFVLIKSIVDMVFELPIISSILYMSLGFTLLVVLLNVAPRVSRSGNKSGGG